MNEWVSGRLLLGSAIVLAFALQGGCSTMRAYDGEKIDRKKVARVVGDWRLSAGAPVSVFLRRVDGMQVGIQYIAVDLVPGRHRLLVDCTVRETRQISRHSLDVEVREGRYKLMADTQLGESGCSQVRLERVRTILNLPAMTAQEILLR